MKTLLVVSNHPPEKWGEAQREGWERIDYIPFPNVPPQASREEVCDIATTLAENIGAWVAENPAGKVCLQGEFSLFYILVRVIGEDIFVFPTTERVVEEKTKEDGTVEKTYRFRFVRWR